MEVVSLAALPTGVVAWAAPAPALSVVVKATFSLAGDGDAALADEQEPLGLDRPSGLDPDELAAASDFAPRKAFADVLLVGHAHATAPEEAILVQFEVGDLARRVFALAGEPSRRIPLSSSYLRARPDPESPVVRVGPQAPRSPARLALAGGRALSPNGLPEGALDRGFDFRFFNAAPSEQQTEALPAGATLVLHGLLRGASRRAFRLPAAPPAVFFVERSGDPLATARALAPRCDTLTVDTDRERCTLVWRAAIPRPADLERYYLVVAPAPPGARPAFAELVPFLDRAPRTRAVEPEDLSDDEDAPPTPRRIVTGARLVRGGGMVLGRAGRLGASGPTPETAGKESPSEPEEAAPEPAEASPEPAETAPAEAPSPVDAQASAPVRQPRYAPTLLLRSAEPAPAPAGRRRDPLVETTFMDEPPRAQTLPFQRGEPKPPPPPGKRDPLVETRSEEGPPRAQTLPFQRGKPQAPAPPGRRRDPLVETVFTDGLPRAAALPFHGGEPPPPRPPARPRDPVVETAFADGPRRAPTLPFMRGEPRPPAPPGQRDPLIQTRSEEGPPRALTLPFQRGDRAPAAWPGRRRDPLVETTAVEGIAAGTPALPFGDRGGESSGAMGGAPSYPAPPPVPVAAPIAVPRRRSDPLVGTIASEGGLAGPVLPFASSTPSVSARDPAGAEPAAPVLPFLSSTPELGGRPIAVVETIAPVMPSSTPRAAQAEPLLALDRYAAVRAELWGLPASAHAAALETHGLTEVEWLAHEARYAEAIEAEAREGRADLAVRTAQAVAAAQRSRAPALDREGYLALKAELDAATDTAAVLRARGISPRELRRLERKWRRAAL